LLLGLAVDTFELILEFALLTVVVESSFLGDPDLDWL